MLAQPKNNFQERISMIIHDQELNLHNAVAVSRIGIEAIQSASHDLEIDLSALTTLDSSAVAVMLTWQRYAQSLNRRLHFIGVPASILSLVAVYGLGDFFNMSASTTQTSATLGQ